MALSLQDLLVGFDAGAPQAPRANAPAQRGTPAHDPFAALFAAQSSSPKPTSTPAPHAPSAPRPTQPLAQTADVSRPRPQRPANPDANQDNGKTSAPSAKSADTSTDTSTRTSDSKPADDKTTKVSDSSNADDTSNDTSNDTADGTNASVTATPAGVAPVVVDVVQLAQLANAQGDANSDVTAPVAGVAAPGAKTGVVANASAQGLAKSDDHTDAQGAKSANPLADPPAKGNKTDTAALFAAFTAPDQNNNAVDPTVAKVATTAPSADAPAAAPVDPTTTAPTDPRTAQTDTHATPAPQASPVAQVATQAPRDPRATAEAVHEIERPNGTEPASQAATVQVAAQTTRPADITGKTAPRVDSTNKSSHTTSKSTSDGTVAPTAPAQDTTIANAVAPVVAPTKDATPIATIAATPAPVVDDDAPAPTENAPATAPIAAPAAGNQQVHQLYAKAAASGPALPQATVDQVVAHVTKAADDGIDHLTIQLKPAHLGAIEVKLELHDDGGLAKATISADRADTLDLLQRDSHRLERALENAGIKADAGSLSFNLRGDGGRQQPTFAQQNNAAPSRPSYTSDDTGIDTSVIAYLNARTARGGVDIRV